MLRATLALAALCLVGSALQDLTAQGPPSGVVAATPASAVMRAVRAARPPVLDGRDDDEAWRDAPVIDGFRQFEPAEDGDPAFPTEARVVYDDRNLYVFVRAFDPDPDSLISRLSRRDVRTNSDAVGVLIDGYRDRRTGVNVSINPAGVRWDAAMFQDNQEDPTWDGVWEAATRIDSLGWTAEFRIPFSQLRFSDLPEHRFGFAVWRDIARRNERVAWPLYRRSRQGVMSQIGTIEGIAGIKRSSRLELLPFVTTRNETVRRGDDWTHPQRLDAGLDFKYGVKENVTVDATINPDFGQVEADPAILNLTAFEVRFDERRPFFQEGVGLYRCGPCQGVFYTRRIGRAPQLRGAGDPVATTILGAGKVTARFGGGLSLGLVEAVTQRETGRDGKTIEPGTNYFVGRLVQEMREGRSSLGLLVTAVNRSLDGDTEPFLRREAYTAVLEGTHRFAGDRFELLAYTGENRVSGSRAALARTQLSAVHYWQRPGGERAFDSTRTSMGGRVVAGSFARIAGALRYSTFIRHAGPGMELNDLGLVPLVNDFSIRNTVTLQPLRPTAFFRSSFSFLESENRWTTGGLPSGNAIRLHTSFSLRNSWGTALTAAVSNYGNASCVSCARGGPAVRQSASHSASFFLQGDPRLAFVPSINAGVARGDDGRSSERSAGGRMDLRVASQLSFSLGGNLSRRTDNQQWVGNAGDPLSDTTHYTFARLRQTTLSLTVRASWTATPTLSVQLYGQPFVSSGSFSDWRELADPGAAAYEQRYRPYGGGDAPPGFNVKQFNSNAVLRWEYRPGSALFLVWQQGRAEDGRNPGSFAFARDYRDLFRAHPENTLLLKATYWFNP